MPVLYRKYRPNSFSEVVGQKHIVRTLQNAVKGKNIAHAYLFTGGRGVGKTSIARILAKAVNCLNSENGDACLTCAHCAAFSGGGFLDLVEIDAASNTGVDNIRELLEHVQFQPSQGAYKVFIIDEVHMLSKGAFNALLKTLEEPPKYIIFILATTEIGKVPATVISRTQRFDFHRHSERDLEQHILFLLKQENRTLPKGAVSVIVRSASGGMRDALSNLDKVLSFDTGSISLSEIELVLGTTSWINCDNLLKTIIAGKVESLHGLFNSLLEQSTDMFLFNRDFLEFLRNVIIAGTAGVDAVSTISEDDKVLVESSTKLLSVNDLLYVTRLFLRSLKEFSVTLQPELPMLLAGIEASLHFQSKNVQPLPLRGTSLESDVPRSVPPMPESRANPVASEIVSPLPVMTESDSAPITLDALQLLWPQVCDAVKAINGPLSTLVRNAPILSVDKGIISIGVKFLFHKEHLESVKIQTILSDSVYAVFKVRLRVRAEILKAESVTEVGNSGTITDALRVFGGELVE